MSFDSVNSFSRAQGDSRIAPNTALPTTNVFCRKSGFYLAFANKQFLNQCGKKKARTIQSALSLIQSFTSNKRI